MKKIITIKNKKYNKKTKKYNLIGSSDNNSYIKQIIEHLKKRVLETYNFLPCEYNTDNKCELYKDYLFKLEGDNIIDSGFSKFPGLNLNSYLENNKETIEDSYYDYELYYPDYHGYYVYEKNKELNKNIYLCIFGFHDTSSLIIDNYNVNSFNKFFKNIKKKDKFETICKYKCILNNPEFKYNISIDYPNNEEYTKFLDCFTKSTWIYPGQLYKDISFCIGDTNKLENTYKSTLISDKPSFEIIKNKKELISLSKFIEEYCNDDNKKYIIFLDSCRTNMIDGQRKYNNFNDSINAIYYKNQSLNYAIMKHLYNNQKLEHNKIAILKKGICSSDDSKYKNLFFEYYNNDETTNINYSNIPNKNDNYHPLIPKLKYIYDSLIKIRINKIEKYFEKQPNDLLFIMILSFNKLKKFLIKLKEINEELCIKIIECIKNDTNFSELFGYYNKTYNSFINKYTNYDENLNKIYHNFKLNKFLFDYLEISYIFNSKKVSNQHIEKIQKTQFATIFSLDNIKRSHLLETHSKKIILSNLPIIFNLDDYPFIKDTKLLFKDVEEIIIYNNLFSNNTLFRISNIPNNKLTKLHIDTSSFFLRESMGKFTLQDIINKFDITKKNKELILKGIVIDRGGNTENKIIKFKDFKIIKINCNGSNRLLNIDTSESDSLNELSLINCEINTKTKFGNINNLVLDNIIIKDTIQLITNINTISLNNIQTNFDIELPSKLKVLKLSNIDTTIKINFSKNIETLDIINCKEINETNLSLSNIQQLNILDSEITSSERKNLLIKKSKNLTISIKKLTIQHMIFLKNNIKNSKISIDSRFVITEYSNRNINFIKKVYTLKYCYGFIKYNNIYYITNYQNRNNEYSIN